MSQLFLQHLQYFSTYQMDIFKNKTLHLAALAAAAVGLGYYFVTRRNQVPVVASKVASLPQRQTDAQLLLRFTQIVQSRANLSSSQPLSTEDTLSVLKYAASLNLDMLRRSTQIALSFASNQNNEPINQRLIKVLGALKEKQAFLQQTNQAIRDVLNAHGSHGDHSAEVNQWIHESVTEEHLELARQSIIARTQYVRNIDQQTLNTLRQFRQNISKQDASYLPFLLNTIITASVQKGNPSFVNQGTNINLTTRKYADKLSRQLSSWQKQVQALHSRLSA